MTIKICIDLETTGLSYKTNEIIEIGLVKIIDNKIVDRYSSLVKPRGKLLSFITKLTGINQEMLINAPSFAEIAPTVLKFIGEKTLVAHNAAFDLDMLNQELKRINYQPVTNPVIDTKDLALLVFPDFFSHKLSSLATYFNYKFNYHRALADAECVANILIKFCEEIPKLNPVVLAEAVKLLPDNKKDLKDFLMDFYMTVDKSKNLYYLDYLENYKKIKKVNKQKKTIEDLHKFFQKNSPLRENFSNFEIRESQSKMANFIWDCFSENNFGAIEAGTGIGKTIAYLLPSIIWARKNNTPVVISTKTKHLQNQIIYQDILKVKSDETPLFTYALIKGKENYIDITKFDTIYQNYSLGLIKKDVIEFLGLLNWLLKTKTGDLSELHSSINNVFYYKVHFTSFSDGIFKKNVFKSKCFVNKMRRRAKDVDLVITNHALVFSDFLNNSQILPEYKYLIFDEAHSIEDVASNITSINFNNFTLKEIFKLFKENSPDSLFSSIKKINLFNKGLIDADLMEELRNCNNQLIENSESFFEALKIFLKSQKIDNPEKNQFMVTSKIKTQLEWIDVEAKYQILVKTLLDFVKLFDAISQKINLEENKTEITKKIAKRILDASQFLTGTIANLQIIFSFSNENIMWLETQNIYHDQLIKLVSAPVDLRSFFQSLLEEKASCIFTSATLTINKSFDYFLDRLGFKDEKSQIKRLYLESEFNFYEQAVFNIITNLPTYNDDQSYFKNIATIIYEIIAKLDKKTLVLFTSQKALKLTYNYLRTYSHNHQATIFCQNLHGSRESIIERFKQNERGVILGLDSFWEGIDFAGDLLQCVVLQKMPFPVPSEPLNKARIDLLEKEGKNGFRDYMLPMAVLKFKQGVGRLIRTKNDTGQLFILDERVFNKSYGKSFLNEIGKFKQKIGTLEEILG